MNEHQFYEFLALDRPLADAEMAALRALAPRAEISRDRFANEFHWGDLRADPRRLLLQSFDVAVYATHWGTRRLLLKLPAGAVDLATLSAYFPGDAVSATREGDQVLLDLWSRPAEPLDRDGAAGWAGRLAGLRAELMRGDLRGAYLAWLGAVRQEAVPPEALEPPLPPGLTAPTAAQESLRVFLRVDEETVRAAADRVAAPVDPTGALAAWIASLDPREKDRLLLAVAQGEGPQLGTALLRRFHAAQQAALGRGTGARWTAGAILEARRNVAARP